eukprot:6711181-Pyramimonas_sp.AAC.2
MAQVVVEPEIEEIYAAEDSTQSEEGTKPSTRTPVVKLISTHAYEISTARRHYSTSRKWDTPTQQYCIAYFNRQALRTTSY